MSSPGQLLACGVHRHGKHPSRTGTAKKIIKRITAKKTIAGKPAQTPRPIKKAFNRTTLNQLIVEPAGIEPKVVKSGFPALKMAILSSVHKKGLREFTLLGLPKISAQHPGEEEALRQGSLIGAEREFAAKPASVKRPAP